MTQVALVTGAGSGIGQQSALALVNAGFHVVLTGRRESALNETIALCASSEKMTAISCDVTQSAAVDALYAQIEAQHGRLDVLFNNAGTNVPAMPIDELTVEQWKLVIDVNLTGAFLAARGAFALMRKQSPQGGRIINNGSISAYVPRPGSVPYTVSKHAITGLTRTLSLDGRAFNIACGQIDIGNTASDMTEQMNSGVPQADGSIKPEPTMDTSHVANAVVNMAQLPLDANVQFMTIMASAMPFIGRG
ncbi:MAG: NAD(P)-dependent dehydrogenase (short-subunit alcohol dehydrogenase family) [bacterium]|jgi:NAD(P)-dependent dehydrogenase (short-subunit alcohol dehydrogenase family)